MGHVYEGSFKNNKRHGLGKLTHSDGKVEEGIFEENIFVGKEQPKQKAKAKNGLTASKRR